MSNDSMPHIIRPAEAAIPFSKGFRRDPVRPTIVGLALIASLHGIAGCSTSALVDLLGEGEVAALDDSFIRLKIINDSGLDATVYAAFYLGTREVRRTERRLAAEGLDQSDLIVPTQVDRIVLSAEAEWTDGRGGVHTVTLATDQIDTADESALDGVIEWVIPAFTFDDCNENDVPDDLDIGAGDSDDMDENGIPDECEVSDSNSIRP